MFRRACLIKEQFCRSETQLHVLYRQITSKDETPPTLSWFHVTFGIIVGGLSVAAWFSHRDNIKQSHRQGNGNQWQRKYRKLQKQYLVDHDGYQMPSFFMDQRETIKKLPVREGDVFVASFPKAGTTWVQEIVYLLLNGADTTETENIEDRFPYLEYLYPGPKEVAKKDHPWLVKTHVPYYMLPKAVNKAKVIYIARNPKDTAVSMTFFMKMVPVFEFKGDFHDFFYMDFINNTYGYAPWWRHVTEYWSHRHDDNLLFITYEQLSLNPSETIKKIGDFLGVRVSDSDIETIANRTSFTNMKNNDLINYSWWKNIGLADEKVSQFMRKGKVGDWQNHYSTEMSDWVDNMVKEKVTPSGLQFLYAIDNQYQDTPDS